MNIKASIYFRLLRFFLVRELLCSENVIFLTFDDGPESGITEFVLNELGKYNFKATFFCRGDNAEKNPDLIEEIRRQGHSIANHTYSHLHGLFTDEAKYLDDIEYANKYLDTALFRPPHGLLSFRLFNKIRRKYKIILWTLDSSDSRMMFFNKDEALKRLVNGTCSGSVVLFHFCHKHEKETRELLPEYLKWLNDNGYTSKGLE